MPKSLLNNLFVSTLFVYAGLVLHSECSAASAYTSNVPYQQAVPNLIDDLKEKTAQVKDDQELQEIAQWETDTRNRLPEFLNDLLVIAQSLEKQGISSQYILDEYQTFSKKWNQVSQTYPGLNELDPVLKPIMTKLLEGLPTLPPPSSDNPMSGFASLYHTLEAKNPWGMAALFQIPFLPEQWKTKNVQEQSHEMTIAGVKMLNIAHRRIKVDLNGVTVYYELKQDDQLIEKTAEFRSPSVIHETLEAMIQNHEDPQVIQNLQNLVDLIDLHLNSELNKGVLDECSYAYLYRKDLTGNLSKCTDYLTQQRNVSDILKYDPEDDINQVFLSHPGEFWSKNLWQDFETDSDVLEQDSNKNISSGAINNYIDPKPLTFPSIPPQAVPLVVIPGTLITVLGLMKLF